MTAPATPPSEPDDEWHVIKINREFLAGFCWGFGIAAATAGMVALLVVLA